MFEQEYLERIYQMLKNLVDAIKRLSGNPDEDDESNDKYQTVPMTDEDWELVAFHEIGHAIVGRVVYKNAIIEEIDLGEIKGGYKGCNIITSKNNMLKKSDFLDEIAFLLGGMCAEDLVYGEHSAGCYGDLQEAKKTIKYMLNDCGMGKRLTYSEDYTEVIDEEMEEIFQKQRAIAEKVLKENVYMLYEMQKELVAARKFNKEKINQLFDKFGI